MELIQLKEHISERLGIENPVNIDEVLSKFKLEKFKKGDIILSDGEVFRRILFVCKGHIQILYYGQDFNKWTRDFISVNEWCCSMESFLNQIPSMEEIKCIAPTTVLSIDKNNFDLLMSRFPDFGTVYKQILTELYLESMNRIQFVLSNGAKERIKWLYENKREYVSNYTSKMLASYLHLNKDVYSRLRPYALKEL